MILKHSLDLIFMSKSKEQEPIPESTPCWDWISNRFQKTAERLKKSQDIYLTFYLYRDGKFTYSLGTFDAYKEIKSKFSVEEVLSCREIAYYNRIHFSITEQPIKSSCKKVIQFIY